MNNHMTVALEALKIGVLRTVLDPRVPGVILPESLKMQKEIILDWDLRGPIPVVDLQVLDSGIQGILMFNRLPYWCYVPWSSVLAIGCARTGPAEAKKAKRPLPRGWAVHKGGKA